MKSSPILLLLLLVCMISCKHKGPDFSINKDTLEVNVKGYLDYSYKYKDKYLLVFHSQPFDADATGTTNCYFINTTENEITEIKETPYWFNYNFFTRNDSIFVSIDQEGRASYCDEKQYKWVPIDFTPDVIYEDEEYRVHHSDFGEWGHAIWFMDKKTGYEYEARINGKEVIRINGIFYILSENNITRVTDPKKLVNAGKGAYKKYRELMDNTNTFYSRGPRGYTGFDVLYDNFINYGEPRYNIQYPFEHNGKLHFLVADSTETYIGTLDKGNVKKVKHIADSLHFSSYNMMKRTSLPVANSRMFFQKINGKQYFGFMENNGISFKLQYLKNTWENAKKPH